LARDKSETSQIDATLELFISVLWSIYIKTNEQV